MEKKLQEKLYKKYPKIFADKDKPMTETCLCWGLDIGNGWENLLDNLCGCIQGYIDNNKHLKISQIIAIQVKSKFASLRFYYNGGDAHIHGMVSLAEYQSYNTCEDCGKTGNDVKQNSGGWIVTLCKDCRKKNAKEKAISS